MKMETVMMLVWWEELKGTTCWVNWTNFDEIWPHIAIAIPINRMIILTIV